MPHPAPRWRWFTHANVQVRYTDMDKSRQVIVSLYEADLTERRHEWEVPINDTGMERHRNDAGAKDCRNRMITKHDSTTIRTAS